MSLFPDRSSDPNKETVLSKTPYLRTFLDSKAKQIDPSKWEADLKAYGKPIGEAFETKLGPRVAFFEVAQTVMTDHLGVFKNGLTIRERFNFVDSMLKFGYELQNIKDGVVLFTDILQRFVDEDIFNHDLRKTSQGTDVIFNTCKGLLSTGMFLRNVKDDDSGDGNDSPSDLPPDNNLEKLLEGIDLNLGEKVTT